ncbi:MAG: hypothetical protein TQ35_0008585 [Candidatus Aramenus sulfurataquae]|uniref:Uncharacterized protein n=2 Tax=Candidatus Aramenus sulfurataquae TaxID=1326980 RepID=A0AAE3FLT3_9CREN|nr:hypothetical protein [Candidatus Aramenus sulfurataquae]
MKELAFLSNQMTSALISMDTNVAWFPAPRLLSHLRLYPRRGAQRRV